MLTALLPVEGRGEQFPSRPVRLIVPFAAGGGVDIMARIIGQKLTDIWGQPVIIEDRGGAAGAIGAQVVAGAEPDGYTLLFTADNVLTINPIIKKVSYDPIKSFAPISQVSAGSYIFGVNPGVKATNIKEFVALAKAHPGTMNFGTPGTGSLHHLGLELFKYTAGVDMVHVPYTGTGPAVMAVLQGNVQLTLASISAGLAQVHSGGIRALAVTGMKRSPTLPDVPTVAESGYPDYEVTGWYGVLAPAGTPSNVVEKISADIQTVLARPDVQAKLAEQGSDPAKSSPKELSVLIASDLAKWSHVIKQMNLRLE